MGLAVGIDIGGTKIAGGIVDDDGNILQMDRRSTPSRGPDALEKVVIDLVNEYKSEYDIEAVGIGFAGFVDEKRSRVLLAPNLGWSDEPLQLAIESKVNIPVVVENDANAAAWGEYRFSGAQLPEDMVCVTVGTGIGGGLILGGNLYRGAHGLAAEFGHLNIEPGGRLCACGNRGCWSNTQAATHWCARRVCWLPNAAMKPRCSWTLVTAPPKVWRVSTSRSLPARTTRWHWLPSTR